MNTWHVRVPGRLLVCAAPLCAGTASAEDFIVTSANDNNDGACNAQHCSLREAIILANNNGSAADSIRFSILVPIRGTILIQPTTPLPTILHPVTIDGYSQGGSHENDDPVVSNAILRLRLDGSLLGNGTPGLGVCSSDVTVQGLWITGFKAAGITFGRDNTNSSCGTSFANWNVYGNFIGLPSPSTTVFGNTGGPGRRTGRYVLAHPNSNGAT